MKIATFTVLTVSAFNSATNYVTIEERYNDATLYCQSISTPFQAIAADYKLDSKELIPIIFPECLRYSDFSDQLETSALEYLYVLYGSDGANFSIGHFQMKPKFIETIETELAKSTLTVAQQAKFGYSSTKTEEIRAERVSRLSSDEWQMHYLCAFYCIMEQKTTDLIWTSNADKVSYFAAAYNLGFQREPHEIETWENEAKFPYGENGYPQPYAEIASDYYLKTTAHEN